MKYIKTAKRFIYVSVLPILISVASMIYATLNKGSLIREFGIHREIFSTKEIMDEFGLRINLMTFIPSSISIIFTTLCALVVYISIKPYIKYEIGIPGKTRFLLAGLTLCSFFVAIIFFFISRAVMNQSYMYYLLPYISAVLAAMLIIAFSISIKQVKKTPADSIE